MKGKKLLSKTTGKKIALIVLSGALASFGPIGAYTPINASTVSQSTSVDSATKVYTTLVKLNKTKDTITLGGTDILTATVSPSNASNKSVTWSSSDTKVATVDSNGKVTAKSKGKTTITCTTKDESKKSAKCKIDVTDSASASKSKSKSKSASALKSKSKSKSTSETKSVKVKSIKLNNENLSLKAGNTSTLSTTVFPSNANNKEVTWKSSDEKVATVDSTGNVTAVAKGTANITCTANDGSKKKAKCKVNVTDSVSESQSAAALKSASVSKPKITAKSENVDELVKVKSIKLDKTSLSLTEGDKITLTSTIAPNNATNQNVTWISSNPKIATVNNGVITALSTGTATVTAITIDGNKTSNCSVNVNSVVDNNSETQLKADQSLTVSSVDIPCLTTIAGTVPTLPTTTNVTLSDGTTKNVAITWNTAATEASTYAYAGPIIINGILEKYDNYPVCTPVIVNLAVGQTTNKENIDLSLLGYEKDATIFDGQQIPTENTVIFFTLNVANSEDYTVIVRGNNAVYDKMNKRFSVLVNVSEINLVDLKFNDSDFIVTKKNTM